ncbi:MAG: o-succinylbenzoate synthase [Ferruginibacter sp.]|nr:o-succinylbenzoate synthase [Cytophagales bacterium]
MSLRAVYQQHTLYFRFEAGTSRGVLTDKASYFVRIFDPKRPGPFGLGECSPLKGLSPDDRPDFEAALDEICDRFNRIGSDLHAWDINAVVREWVGDAFPAIQFGFETALLDWQHGGKRLIFDNAFFAGNPIDINGLIWMDSEGRMRAQIDDKLREGYQCLKLKIGAIDFEGECRLLHYVRQRYPASRITLRVDANGAFSADEAPEKLRQLAQFGLHSIEQPIRAGQSDQMAALCRRTPLPIALDEELIGVATLQAKKDLLEHIRPQYIILKPTLLGGFGHCREWIALAESLRIGWWITSALESNVGLNAISQFTAEFNNPLPQGLGTGQLYTNNVTSPLTISGGQLHYDAGTEWNLGTLSGLTDE